ncbi:hypothetical protein KAI19_03290 [bacterium]|nr:hypothetical protein [bacterium]
MLKEFKGVIARSVSDVAILKNEIALLRSQWQVVNKTDKYLKIPKSVIDWKLKINNSLKFSLKIFTLISLIYVICGASFSIQAAENSEMQKTTRITSDRMEMNWSKNVAVFIGNALLVDEDGRVEADKIEVFLAASEKGENQEDIEKVIAIGNVKITAPERRTKSGKAVFHKKKDVLILTDNPEVWQKGTRFTGGRITFDLKKDTMVIDKDVQGSVESSKKKGKDENITD